MFCASTPSTRIRPVLSLVLAVCSVYCIAREAAIGESATWGGVRHEAWDEDH
jgi:hypothetical protein